MEVRPIDGNALAESLSESYTELRKLCASINEDAGGKEVYQGELVAFIEAILRTKNMPTLDYVLLQQWISVKDRLPDTDHTMLVCTRNRNNVPKIAMAYYENGFGWCGSGGRWNNVTHWMPLPEPPKEVGNDEND